MSQFEKVEIIYKRSRSMAIYAATFHIRRRNLRRVKYYLKCHVLYSKVYFDIEYIARRLE